MHLKADDPRLGVLRFSYTWTLTIEALHTLCTEPGDLRSRLLKVDPEYYALREESFPDLPDIRANWKKVLDVMDRTTSRGESIEVIQGARLDDCVQAIWEIHRDFGYYMQGE